MPLVSIITPVYNAEKYLQETVSSVLNQSFVDWELFLIDDFSQDKSRELIQNLAKQDTRIIPIFKERNSGSAETRNLGIQLAKGRYIAFLDADDLWDKTFLENSIQTLQDFQVGFCFSSYRIIDEEGKEFLPPFIIEDKNYTYFDILFYNRVGILTAIYDQTLLGKMFFDTRLKSLRDDYALWLDILKKIPCGRGRKEISASYRVRKNSMTSNRWKVLKSHYQMFRIHEELNPFYSFGLTSIHLFFSFWKYFLKRAFY